MSCNRGPTKHKLRLSVVVDVYECCYPEFKNLVMQFLGKLENDQIISDVHEVGVKRLDGVRVQPDDTKEEEKD